MKLSILAIGFLMLMTANAHALPESQVAMGVQLKSFDRSMTLVAVNSIKEAYVFSIETKDSSGITGKIDRIDVKLDEITVVDLGEDCNIRAYAKVSSGVFFVVIRQLGHQCPGFPAGTNLSGVYL